MTALPPAAEAVPSRVAVHEVRPPLGGASDAAPWRVETIVQPSPYIHEVESVPTIRTMREGSSEAVFAADTGAYVGERARAHGTVHGPASVDGEQLLHLLDDLSRTVPEASVRPTQVGDVAVSVRDAAGTARSWFVAAGDRTPDAVRGLLELMGRVR